MSAPSDTAIEIGATGRYARPIIPVIHVTSQTMAGVCGSSPCFIDSPTRFIYAFSALKRCFPFPNHPASHTINLKLIDSRAARPCRRKNRKSIVFATGTDHPSFPADSGLASLRLVIDSVVFRGTCTPLSLPNPSLTVFDKTRCARSLTFSHKEAP